MLNLVANGPSGYTLSNSLRFRASATAYLSRTFATAGTSTTTKTFSAWVKRGALGIRQPIFGGYDGSSGNNLSLEFESTDTLQLYFGGAAAYEVTTTQVFRDSSAWYHIVATFDTTQATAANRYKLYINGNQVTAFGTANYPPQNSVVQFGIATANNKIGTWWNSGSYWFDGYLTEVNFIDGQALTPSSFGSTNATTNVWQPVRYTGTYGTNGFYLNFSNIALTSGSNTGLGKDSSGNGNYWNTNNISVTAGSTYDSMTDVPTLTSTTTANYSVLNPLFMNGSSISKGNLEITGGIRAAASFGITSGKWYWECQTTHPSYYMSSGVLKDGAATTELLGYGDTLSWGWYAASGQKWFNTANTSWGSAFTSTNDVLGVAFDADAGTLTFYKNGSLQGGGAAFTGLTSGPYYPGISSQPTYFSIINFGQRPFQYSAPSGFLPLNTYNLA